ncbi:MAG: hypothetical protein ACXU89_09405 [Xanthobacteraceae bacterium]
MNENEDKADALRKYEPADLRRDSQPGYTSVWSPRMTEQQRKEREQQIESGIIPF